MSGFLDGPAPRWFTIAAHRPFLDDLAGEIWRTLSPLGVDAVSQAVVLVPNRRAARALATAFLDAAGPRAVLPPQIRAIGDLDEDEPPFEAIDAALDLPPAISPARRRFELAGLVAANGPLLDRTIDAGGALDLADALARFLDACQIEELGEAPAVDTLVEGDLARHWQASADFLAIALEAWPARLAKLGLMDAAARRVALLRRLTERWSGQAPEGILIAAGSTGSTKATADLLTAVAAAPRGCVVLPGLDLSLADSAWRQVGDQHPQGALRRLLAGAGVARGDVQAWPGSAETPGSGRWRRRLINEALRPPEATADWLEVIKDIRREGGPDPIAQGLQGLTLISARGEEEAASAAALLLREALETPGRTAALITPDPALARRVTARLTRWNITADSSVGLPLAANPAPVLAHLVARSFDADPVTLLGIVKHPLTRLGLPPEDLAVAREALERYGLRGPRPDGWDGLAARLLAKLPDEDGPRRPPIMAAIDLAERLQSTLAIAQAPFTGKTARVSAAARALAECLEALGGGAVGLWAGQAGEALGALFAGLLEESEALPPVTASGFAELLDGLMSDELVRRGGASHPRLRILGVLEARLIRADLTILAGLEEGMWPAPAPIDPFLSRPMRERLGLPSPERRIGLSAHDFAQAACAPEVVLLSTQRRGGAPAVASRWLWRLETLLKGADLEPPGRPEVLAWAGALDAPLAVPPPGLATATRPRPAPPVAARPRELPVTAIERWVRDPYAIYAQRILRLRPLDPPGAPVEALARGIAIHRAFERFATDYPDAIPDGAEALFESLIMEELLAAGMPRARMTREQALAANVAPWVLDFERRRRPGARLLVEQKGSMSFPARAGPFTLTARADRIEVREGGADILDFKTGAAPSKAMVRSGLAPQLTLTAALLAGGGFLDLGPLAPGELLYVKVSGGRVPGREEPRDEGEAAALAEAALAGLKRRVAWFDDPATPYVSRAAPQFIDSLGDYDHLARLWEWHVIGEAEAAE